MDHDTNVFTDYHQYRLDLDKANQKREDTLLFDKAYSALDYYHLSDLSASSIQSMIRRMEEDNGLLSSYIKNFYADGPLSKDDIAQVDSMDIKRKYICAAKYSTIDDQLACLGNLVKNNKSMLLWKVFEKLQGKWYRLVKE